MTFVNINTQIVLLSDIQKIDLSTLSSETITVTLKDNTCHEVSGFPALEIIWLVNPSILEGNPNIKFKKHMWAVHNLIAHPLMQILAWFKQYKLAIKIHNKTIPKPIQFKQIKTDQLTWFRYKKKYSYGMDSDWTYQYTPDYLTPENLEQYINEFYLSWDEGEHFRGVICELVQYPPKNLVQELILSYQSHQEFNQQFISYLNNLLKELKNEHPTTQ